MEQHTLKKYEEAYRSVHNLYNQWQGLGELRDVLANTLKTFDDLQTTEAELKKAEGMSSVLLEEIAKQEERLTNIKEIYAVKGKELEAKVQEDLDRIKSHRESEQEKLSVFLKDNQIRINKVRENLENEENRLKARTSGINSEIRTMIEERDKHEKVLKSIHKKMETVMGDISNG